jgi:hypothetical protein
MPTGHNGYAGHLRSVVCMQECMPISRRTETRLALWLKAMAAYSTRLAAGSSIYLISPLLSAFLFLDLERFLALKSLY